MFEHSSKLNYSDPVPKEFLACAYTLNSLDGTISTIGQSKTTPPKQRGSAYILEKFETQPKDILDVAFGNGERNSLT